MFPVKVVFMVNFRALIGTWLPSIAPTTLGNLLLLSKPLIFLALSAAVDGNLINSS